MFASSLFFSFPSSIDDQSIKLQNTTVQVWQTTLSKDWMIAWICEQLYLSVIMWIFFQNDFFKCILLYDEEKEKVIIGG